MIPRLHRSTEIIDNYFVQSVVELMTGVKRFSSKMQKYRTLTLVVGRCRSRMHSGPEHLGCDVSWTFSERDCTVETVAIVQEQLREGKIGYLEIHLLQVHLRNFEATED